MTDVVPYEIKVSPAVRRALAEKLPLDVAFGATELFQAIAHNPYRLGKRLNPPLEKHHSARLMKDWRVVYTIDDTRHHVWIDYIRHRADAYHT